MRVMTLGGLGALNGGVRVVSSQAVLPRTRPSPAFAVPGYNVAPPTFVKPYGFRGLGELGLTESVGLAGVAFVVGGALGFALGAGVVSSIR